MPYKAKSDLTKAAIKKSFLALLNEKPINQISVRDIAEGCGFNRNTIYYHYDDIPGLVEEIVIETAEKIISDYSDYHSLEACIDKMAEFALEHKRTVLNIYNSSNRSVYELYLMKVCGSVVENYLHTMFGDIKADPESRGRLYEEIVNLYKGRLLPQFATEPWVESVSVRLHGQYRTAILGLLELCKKWGESGRIISLCAHALELDPYEERLYLEEIVALESLGRHTEAQDLARRGNAMGCLHHAIDPGRAGSAYRQMRQADRNMESELSRLTAALPDTENTGACICDFETFKETYRVLRGVQARYGLPVFLAIVTVAPGQNAEPAETATMVEQLGELIHTTLRQCDVAARYSEMQYVIMLSGSAAETGSSPLERIKAAFYRVPAHGRYLLSYNVYVPEIKADSGRARRRKKTTKK